jgi:hypothetical protein
VVKAAETWSRPFTPHLVPKLRMTGTISPLRHLFHGVRGHNFPFLTANAPPPCTSPAAACQQAISYVHLTHPFISSRCLLLQSVS